MRLRKPKETEKAYAKDAFFLLVTLMATGVTFDEAMDRIDNLEASGRLTRDRMHQLAAALLREVEG